MSGRIAVLISGRGSNLQSIIDAVRAKALDAAIAVVVSNRPDAAGVFRAREAGIEAVYLDPREYDGRDAYDRAVTDVLRARGVELVCLAGFMRLLTPGFVEWWRDRIINIHPSLLPAFKGLHSHERALEAGVRLSGCTVHFVRAEMDDGPIIVQAAVPVHPGDDAERLAARVLAVEHRAYKLALRLIAEGRVRVEGEIVEVDGAAPDAVLINPPDDR